MQNSTQIQRIAVEQLTGQRKSHLELEILDASEPRFMTRQQLIDSGVEADENREAFARYLMTGELGWAEDESELMRECFDGGYGHTTLNTVDHVALSLTRGDARLTLSAHMLMDAWQGLCCPYDNACTCLLAPRSPVAVIVTNWVGGDGTTNLLVDFRDEKPLIGELEELHNIACVDAVTVLPSGVIAVRDWWRRLGAIPPGTHRVGPFVSREMFALAQRAFADIPRNEDIASWVYPWPFDEESWDELPLNSI